MLKSLPGISLLLSGLCISASLPAAAATYVEVNKVYFSLSTTPYPGEEGVLEAEVTTNDGRIHFTPDVYEGHVEVPQYFTYEGQKYIVTSVGNSCFGYQKNITGVTLPPSIRKIGDYAFRETPITEITLPPALESVGYSVFGYCYQLTTMVCEAVIPPKADNYFTIAIDPADIQLYVPAGSIEAYTSDNVWKQFTNIQVIPDQQTLPEEITVSPASYSDYIGTSFTATATVLPKDADDKSIVWSSTDENVASVDALGKVSLKAAGTCDIIATSVANPSVKGICRVESNEDTRIFPEQMILDPAEAQLPVGATFHLGITILPEGCFDTSVEYRIVPDEGIIEIDENDNITLLKEGFCYVTVLSNVDHRVGETLPVTSRSDVVTVEQLTYRVKPQDYTCTLLSSEMSFGDKLEVPFDILPGFSDRKRYAVTEIADNVFTNATGITSLILPAELKTIGNGVWNNSKALTTVTVNAVNPPACGSNVFADDIYAECILYVPGEAVDAYKAHPAWSKFNKIIDIKFAGVDTISADGEAARYYNLQGIEIANPEKGQIVIIRQGNRSLKAVM